MKPHGRGWVVFALVAVVLAAATCWTAFAQAFTELHVYDDTGYMLALIRGFNRHGALYTRVFSQYGPFYSEFHALACRWLGVWPTQSSIRWLAVAMRLAASAAGGALAFRLTGRIAFAALAQGFCFLILYTLGSDAGHPVGLCVLCLAAAVCVPLPGRGRNLPLWQAALFGAALGALALVKINLGVFALAAVGTAWAFSTPPDRAGRTLRVAAGGLLCLLPVALVGRAWPMGLRLPFIALMVATFAGMLLVTGRDRAALTWREAGRLALGLLGGWGLMSAVILAGIVASGSRPVDVLDGVLRRPLSLALIFAINPNTGAGTLVEAVLALAGALAWRFAFPAGPGGAVRRGQFERAARVGFLILAACWLLLGRGYSIVMLFLWVALLPVEAETDVAGPFARRALALLAGVEFLSLYPVAGVQIGVPDYLGALAAIVFAARWWTPAPAENNLAAARWQRWGTVALALAVLATFGIQTARAWRMRARTVPLDLLGSPLIRAEEGQMAAYTFLAHNLAGQNSFLTLPGLNSLYDLAVPDDYPGDLNCTENFALLTPAEQRSLVEAGRGFGPVAMVFSREAFDFWVSNRAPATGPLVDFYHQECEPFGEAGGFELLRCTTTVRPGASAPDLSGYARLEEQEVNGQRQPTGQIFLSVPPHSSPANAVLVNIHGDALAPPIPLIPRVNTWSSHPTNYTLTLPNPGVLRDRSPDDMCLRLCDERSQRVTTVPFFVPAETSRGTRRPAGEP